jgi:hypothetical protein
LLAILSFTGALASASSFTRRIFPLLRSALSARTFIARLATFIRITFLALAALPAFFARSPGFFRAAAIPVSGAGELTGFVGLTPLAIFPLLAVLAVAIAIRLTGAAGITPRLYIIRILFGRRMLAMSTFSGLS